MRPDRHTAVKARRQVRRTLALMAMTVQEAIDRTGFGAFQRRLFLVCAVTWAADAAEIFLLSFALPGFSEEFDLSSQQAGLVVTSTFAGMLVGAWFWGAVSDRIGRRTGFQLTVAVFALFGLASAFAPDATWLAALRFVTGFGLGGALPLDFSVFAEYLPTRNRGRWLVLLESFWAVGTVGAAGLALVIMPSLGWRYLLATSAVAGVLVLWVRRQVPESARYLVSAGRAEEAQAILDRVAHENGITPTGQRIVVPSGEARSTRLWTLLEGGIRRVTLTLWTTWLLIAFAYYGIFVWLPQVLSDQYGFLNTYVYVFFIAVVQLPGYFSAAWLLERWGRLPVLRTYLAVSGAATLPVGGGRRGADGAVRRRPDELLLPRRVGRPVRLHPGGLPDADPHHRHGLGERLGPGRRRCRTPGRRGVVPGLAGAGAQRVRGGVRARRGGGHVAAAGDDGPPAVRHGPRGAGRRRIMRGRNVGKRRQM